MVNEELEIHIGRDDKGNLVTSTSGDAEGSTASEAKSEVDEEKESRLEYDPHTGKMVEESVPGQLSAEEQTEKFLQDAGEQRRLDRLEVMKAQQTGTKSNMAGSFAHLQNGQSQKELQQEEGGKFANMVKGIMTAADQEVVGDKTQRLQDERETAANAPNLNTVA